MSVLADPPVCTYACNIPAWQGVVVGISCFIAALLTGLAVWLLIHYGEKGLQEGKEETLHHLIEDLERDPQVEDLSHAKDPKYTRK